MRCLHVNNNSNNNKICFSPWNKWVKKQQQSGRNIHVAAKKTCIQSALFLGIMLAWKKRDISVYFYSMLHRWKRTCAVSTYCGGKDLFCGFFDSSITKFTCIRFVYISICQWRSYFIITLYEQKNKNCISHRNFSETFLSFMVVNVLLRNFKLSLVSEIFSLNWNKAFIEYSI